MKLYLESHFFRHHLRRPMYKCPLCDISSTYHLSNIRVHIRKIHNVTTEPICFKDQFEGEINCLLYRCFGDRQIFRRQDPEVIACLNDMLNYVCDGTPLYALERKTDDGLPAPVHHLSGYLSDGGVSSATLVEPAFNARSQPRNTCRLCFESNVKHLERHVLQVMPFSLVLLIRCSNLLKHHIIKPMYLCPYCNFSSCYSPASVKDHIKTRHSAYDPVPIDMRDEYTELIQSVYDQCFLDDPNTFLNR
ncbi:zinc finger, C2H2 type [Ancylostoma caninum]|uniref:Zinc finger, C2H2 type n=1 Tax=Ancylostoma caninum TaxID=29170 RepID=A0A368H003_ANCCA|nr:zinc finger, C2H2 type [Ancylostoma caninum]